MVGRGMVATPALARGIRAALGDNSGAADLSWQELLVLIAEFWRLVCAHLERDQQTGRLKQWLNLLRRVYPQAQTAFETVRTFHDPADVARWLQVQPLPDVRA
jgi:tRNA-dihydrouridine synthase C